MPTKGKRLNFKTKTLYIILLITFCRLFCSIPVPFVNKTVFQSIVDGNSTFAFMDMLSGNGFSNLSVMALGITPYITASIILQLLSVVFPKLEQMQKGMADDRKKLERYTVVLGIVLAGLQGLSMCIGYGRQGVVQPFEWYSVLCITVIWMAGTAIETLIGKFIADHLYGNGISMILAANILSSYPSDMFSIYQTTIKGNTLARGALYATVICAVIFGMLLFTVFIEGCVRKIPVIYSKAAIGRKMGASESHIPVKLCPGGVVPVIFASTILSVPGFFGTLFGWHYTWMNFFNTGYWFNRSQPYYTSGVVLYVLMIFGFSYYYADIEMNPVELSESLKKNSGVIPGIRAGSATADYIKGIMKRTIFVGAICLSIIAVIPLIFGAVFHIGRVSFLGTSIIIIVSVLLETRKIVDQERQKVSYFKGFQKGGILSL